MPNMERSKFDRPISLPKPTTNRLTFAPPTYSPDYSSKAVQDSLQRLASIDLIELCNEAKVEHCRANKDRENCGCLVENVLTSCGHASLCKECSQLCESCPLCNTPLPKNGNILRPRLYYECVDAGLVPKVNKDLFPGVEDISKAQCTPDVKHLFSLFDVALENNLYCLIRQYVTDVCMDKNVVSSEPAVAFLLDQIVVMYWCRRTFKHLIKEMRKLHHIKCYELEARREELVKISSKFTSLCYVLEVLDLSFKDTHSAYLDDLHALQESILKTKQYNEMMIWCMKHGFLKKFKSRHSDLSSWRAFICERKSFALKRAWPEAVQLSGESTVEGNSNLFIEDAMLNLKVEKGGHSSELEGMVACGHHDGGISFVNSKDVGFENFYPFKSVRAAVDILFIVGSSDMVVAKRAIFLYYLFDSQYNGELFADDDWTQIINDFAATFNITKNSLLESFTYYLLDDQTDEALQDACRLLPEISGPESHPKIAKVLLERQKPEAALMFLRLSGRDNRADWMSLSEAVTAVRVRVECALLTEAFMYQRNLCLKVRDRQLQHKLPMDASDDLEDDVRSWTDWVLVLVTEICSLCIRRNIVDRLIKLPWNSDEERHLHKCLLDYVKNKSQELLPEVEQQRLKAGNLPGDSILCRKKVDFQREGEIPVEQDQNTAMPGRTPSSNRGLLDDSPQDKYKTAYSKRISLGEASDRHRTELLPEVEQQQLKAGNLPEDSILCRKKVDFQRESEIPLEQDQRTAMPGRTPSSRVLKQGRSATRRPFCNGFSLRRSAFHRIFEPSYDSQRFSRYNRFGSKIHRIVTWRRPNPRFKTMPSSNHGLVDDSPQDKYKTAYSKRISLGEDSDRHRTELLPEVEQQQLKASNLPEDSILCRKKVDFQRESEIPVAQDQNIAMPGRTPSSNRGLLDDSLQEKYKTANGKRIALGDYSDRHRTAITSDDAMDISWSFRKMQGPSASWGYYDNMVDQNSIVCVNCKMLATRKTSHSSRNPGREYYRCLSCNKFLTWVDNVNHFLLKQILGFVNEVKTEQHEIRIMVKYLEKVQKILCILFFTLVIMFAVLVIFVI